LLKSTLVPLRQNRFRRTRITLVVPQIALGTTGMAHNLLQGQNRMWAKSLKKLRAGRLSPALQLTCPEYGQEGLCMRFGKTGQLAF